MTLMGKTSLRNRTYFCLQTHDKLLYARHPQRNILSTCARKHINVDRQRELAVVIRHRFCEFSELPSQRSRQRLTVQRVIQRVNPALEIVHQAPLRSGCCLLKLTKLLVDNIVDGSQRVRDVRPVTGRILRGRRSLRNGACRRSGNRLTYKTLMRSSRRWRSTSWARRRRRRHSRVRRLLQRRGPTTVRTRGR